jgi:hypothetical protein
MTSATAGAAPDTQNIRCLHARLASAPTRCRLGCRCRRARPSAAQLRLLRKIPSLCDEIDRLAAGLALATRHQQDLVAAARATLVAAAEGEHDPLYYLRDELRARGLLAQNKDDRPW